MKAERQSLPLRWCVSARQVPKLMFAQIQARRDLVAVGYSRGCRDLIQNPRVSLVEGSFRIALARRRFGDSNSDVLVRGSGRMWKRPEQGQRRDGEAGLRCHLREIH